MKVLDLFSGIGGFSLGLERAGMETVAFCEIEEFPRKVLRKHWPDVPIYEDVRELTAERLKNDGITVDVICGGYPCQPFSTAGKRHGAADDRHLWPEYLRLIQELRPSWVIGENVAGHISVGFDDVLADLEREGYAWEAFVIPACAVDAPHRRDRVWIVANSYGARLPEPAWKGFGSVQGEDGSSKGRVSDRRNAEAWRNWPIEPAVGRVANGIPRRVDRVKALGNSLVPQIPEIIGRAIMSVQDR